MQRSFLAGVRDTSTPKYEAPTRGSASAVTLKRFRCAMAVEPTFAPRITESERGKSMSPEPTKVISKTEANVSDCAQIVNTMPVSSPRSRDEEAERSRSRSEGPA